MVFKHEQKQIPFDKGKGAGLYSTSSNTALSTAQFTPDHWAYSLLFPSQLPSQHTAWLLIRAQN